MRLCETAAATCVKTWPDTLICGKFYGMKLSIEQIKQLLPHRYPFLLLDRVLECIPNDYAVGIKNVSVNEPFFAGHFPHEPVMPGVLIIEAMAQLSGIVMLADSLNDYSNSEPKSMYFVKITEASFKQKVVPGDVLVLSSKKIREKMGIAIFEVEAKVEDQIVAHANIMATMQK